MKTVKKFAKKIVFFYLTNGQIFSLLGGERLSGGGQVIFT